jgi:hypothetical protein
LRNISLGAFLAVVSRVVAVACVEDLLPMIPRRRQGELPTPVEPRPPSPR